MVSDAELKLLADLKWAGLEWDEGPEVGGAYGPYRQSERTHIYQEHAQQLLDQGSAYRCFCSPQEAGGVQTTYVTSGCYQNCSSLSLQESHRRAEGGIDPFTVRLHQTYDNKRVYPDLVYGKIQRLKRSPTSSQSPTEDGGSSIDTGADPILLKSDGTPTYHFANVVDDHLMEITHVIRGSEWAASTPLHYDIYSAFNWTPPQFAHVGLLADQKGAKLSKRNQDLALDVASMRDQHRVLPETLCNFLALLGWSNPMSNDVMDIAALVEHFDLKFTRGNAMVKMEKLWYLQKQHVARRCAIAASENSLEPILDILTQIGEEVRHAYPNSLVNGVITSAEQCERIKSIDYDVENGGFTLWEDLKLHAEKNEFPATLAQQREQKQRREKKRQRVAAYREHIERSENLQLIAYFADILLADSMNYRNAQQWVERNRYFFDFDQSQVPEEQEFYNKAQTTGPDVARKCAQRLIEEFDDWEAVGRMEKRQMSDSLDPDPVESLIDTTKTPPSYPFATSKPLRNPRAIEHLEKRIHDALVYQSWRIALNPQYLSPVCDPPEALPTPLDATLAAKIPDRLIHIMMETERICSFGGLTGAERKAQPDWVAATAVPGSVFPSGKHHARHEGPFYARPLAKDLWDSDASDAKIEGLAARYKEFHNALMRFLREKLAYGLPGPSVSMVMAILGKEECRRRLLGIQSN